MSWLSSLGRFGLNITGDLLDKTDPLAKWVSGKPHSELAADLWDGGGKYVAAALAAYYGGGYLLGNLGTGAGASAGGVPLGEAGATFGAAGTGSALGGAGSSLLSGGTSSIVNGGAAGLVGGGAAGSAASSGAIGSALTGVGAAGAAAAGSTSLWGSIGSALGNGNGRFDLGDIGTGIGKVAGTAGNILSGVGSLVGDAAGIFGNLNTITGQDSQPLVGPNGAVLNNTPEDENGPLKKSLQKLQILNEMHRLVDPTSYYSRMGSAENAYKAAANPGTNSWDRLGVGGVTGAANAAGISGEASKASAGISTSPQHREQDRKDAAFKRNMALLDAQTQLVLQQKVNAWLEQFNQEARAKYAVVREFVAAQPKNMIQGASVLGERWSELFREILGKSDDMTAPELGRALEEFENSYRDGGLAPKVRDPLRGGPGGGLMKNRQMTGWE